MFSCVLYRDNNETGDGCKAVGRPRINICKEELLALRQLNYSWTKIARMLGVCRSTLYRRLEEFGINTDSYSNISSSDLDEIVKDIKASQPNIGEVILNCCLQELKYLELNSALLFTE